MKSNFAKSLKAVLTHEGGYVNNRHDPGGPTNKGVTQKVYDAWRAKRGEQARSVKLIDPAEITEIYRRNYWDAVRADEMPDGVDYVLFDGAVNSGPLQSIKWLQKALPGYTGAIDGVIGVRTLRRVAEDDDNDALIARICTHRMAFLIALKTWSVFGDGWSKRVAGVKAMGQAMATGKTLPKVAFVEDGAARAPVSDVTAPPSKAAGDAIAGAGTAVTTGSLGIQSSVTETIDKLQPYAGLSQTIGTILTYLAIAGAVMVIGGLAWRAYAVWKKRKITEATG